MKKRKRLTNLLIAATLSVLMLTVFLAFRGANTNQAEAGSLEQSAVVELAGEYETDIAVLQDQIESLQAQNEELRAAVSTMQDREIEYQTQIETANQTIEELSAQNSTMTLGGDGFGAFTPRPERHSH
jgi:peptidoglycan hydrolase CwlO-like protein